jgi:hypothetical protein
MNDKRTVSMIDLALQKHDTPVGPLFVAVRHGRIKKCFTQDTAIRYLAFFMTTEAFERSGFPQRHPRVRIDRDDREVWRDGETKAEYLAAHQRCVRRLRRILARKREMEKWRNGVRNGTRCMTDSLKRLMHCRPSNQQG